MILNLFKKKAFVWLLCTIPSWFIIFQAFHAKKFWSKSIVISGYTAAALLAISLVVAPLHKNFPSIRLFNFLNRRKREIGLSVFFYAVFHVIAFFVKENIKTGQLPWIYFLHPVIIPGLIALFIFLLLTLTSSDYSIKKMTHPKWKSLHRTVYIAEGCVFLHMVLQFGTVSIWGCLIFIPLFIIQRLRLQKQN
jgi:sulfoxide reductase heme-binding subunit YedZ